MHLKLSMILVAGLGALTLEGCASAPPMDYAAMPREHGSSLVEEGSGKKYDCVPFAREHSGVKIFGDAVTWWNQAGGRYARGSEPEPGSILVLYGYSGPKHGHVAVVRDIVSSREIRIDHANWLNDGAVYLNDPVVDVSQDNDWSQVRVWNIPNNAWGARIYPVQGFIGPGSDAGAGIAHGGTPTPVSLAGD